MNSFLTTLGNFLPFIEGQELNFINAKGVPFIGGENARLGKKLNKVVCTEQEIATFVSVLGKLAIAEEEAATKA